MKAIFQSPLRLVVFLAIILAITAQAHSQSYGTFVGRVLANWESSGRDMRLEEDFGYIDPNGTKWLVPKGTAVDGASIPRFLWSTVGSPFTGKYRNASVIHDYYCQVQTRPSPIVHKVFFDASVAGGVGKRKAWVMYKAVVWFGPSWKHTREIIPGCEVITEENLEDCVENFVPLEDTKAREPSRAEINEFLREMRTQGYGAEVAEIERVLD